MTPEEVIAFYEDNWTKIARAEQMDPRLCYAQVARKQNDRIIELLEELLASTPNPFD